MINYSKSTKYIVSRISLWFSWSFEGVGIFFATQQYYLWWYRKSLRPQIVVCGTEMLADEHARRGPSYDNKPFGIDCCICQAAMAFGTSPWLVLIESTWTLTNFRYGPFPAFPCPYRGYFCEFSTPNCSHTSRCSPCKGGRVCDNGKMVTNVWRSSTTPAARRNSSCLSTRNETRGGGEDILRAFPQRLYTLATARHPECMCSTRACSIVRVCRPFV